MDSFINAPDAGQIALCGVVIVVASLILIPYVSLLLGGGLISVWVDTLGHQTKEKKKFTFHLIKSITGNVGVGLLLVVVPTLSVGFCFSQFLYGTHSPVLEYFLYASFFYLIGVLLINKYRVAHEILENIQETENTHSMIEDAKTIKGFSGWAGVSFLTVGLFLTAGGYAVSVDPSLWNHGFAVVFASGQVWLKFLALFSGSFAFAGVGMLFFFFSWAGGIEVCDKVKEKALLIGGTLGIVFIPLFTVFTGLHLKFIPRIDFTGGVIVFSALAVAALFVVLHMVYYVVAHKNTMAAWLGFALLVVSFLFVAIADNFTLKNALRTNIHKVEQSKGASDHGGHH